jgi:alcohol dehydrogenase (cytochrome c)
VSQFWGSLQKAKFTSVPNFYGRTCRGNSDAASDFAYNGAVANIIVMIQRVLLFLLTVLTIAFLVQGHAGLPPAQYPLPKLTFERLLKANAEPQNWLTYSGSYASQRYSFLSQINSANVQDLELKWSFPSQRGPNEATPLVVNGVMYTVHGPNDVVALDATSGKTFWTYSHKPDPVSKNCCGWLSRGLAILDDTIFLATIDAQIIAIHAETGQELWKTLAADPKQAYAFTLAPLVVKNKVIAGSAGGEFGVRGFIAAWDVKSGKEVWRFHTVPGPGEPGRETWSGDSWMHGGAPIWVTGSYDPATNLTYWGTGNPGPDRDGRARLGDNLYSCSVVALDADTGKLKWHFQFSPHNEFDWDATQIPVLADMDWQGRPRKLMLFANRNGIFYVLDRVTGEFLKGQPFVKVNWLTGFDSRGRPIPAPGIAPTREGTLVYPGNQGGTNWYNPSYSPRTGLFYIPIWENSSSVFVLAEAPPVFHEGANFSAEEPQDAQRRDDTYSAVRAIDPRTGEKKWDYRMPSPHTDAGVLTTAADILFSGGADGNFYALDARDGKLLWKTRAGNYIQAGPITYSVGGKQYVSIQSNMSILTFGLRN